MKVTENLKVTSVQTNLVWENPEANFKHFAQLIAEIDQPTDLIVLPEMFTTGFSMNVKNLYDTPKGKTLNWLKQQAKSKNSAICGSVIIKENEQYYNRFLFVKPDGNYSTYNKRHLFTLAGEDHNYTAGTQRTVINYKGWKICPLICYDLRFPVWARYQGDYDVLLYVANWPEMRITAWDTLLKARAIENMSYCIGVNRIGKDGNDYPYNGHSAVYDVLGKQCSTTNFETPFIETLSLSKTHIKDTRDKLRFLEDRDDFKVFVD